MWQSNNTELTVPPSPNWYLSKVFDCHFRQGLLAYGAGRNLVFVQPNPFHGAGAPNIRIIHEAHKERITCVAWCQTSETDDRLLVCSGGEDGTLKVWDVKNLNLFAENNAFEGQKVACLAWSEADKRILLAASDSGTFCVWDVESSSSRKISFGKLNPTSLELCPHSKWIAVVAVKGGLLYICNIRDKGTILHKVRAHEDDISNISFCPANGNIFETGNESQVLFATAGKDRFVKIWSLDEAKCLSSGRLQASKSRGGPEDRKSTWIALDWVTRDLLLTSGLNGELLCWNVKEKMTWTVVHKLHARGLFNISCSSLNDETLIWTSAQDRSVVVWPLSLVGKPAEETLGIPALQNPWLHLPTLGGFVYSLSVSPVDSAHVALGVGDGTLRLWNCALGSPQMTSLWNGIKGKVTAVCWHPADEGIIAFGTDEGRVGLFETLKNKPAVISKQGHKGTVYNVTWGKIPGKENFHIFSVGGGQILIHGMLTSDPCSINFNTLIASKPSYPQRTEITFNGDFSRLAVGNEDGSVEIYQQDDLQLLTVIVAHRKLIQSLKFHPQFVTESSEKSQCCDWLAVASNDTAIKVFDLKLPTPVAIATLKGHKDRVVHVAWNPHCNGQLLSASYDGTVQVWDVLKDVPVANFAGHFGRPFVCDWNHMEPGIAMSGGEDFTLRVWKTSEQSFTTPAEGTAAKKTNTEKKKELQIAQPAVQQVSAAKKKTKLKSLFPVSSALEGRGRSHGLDDCRILGSLQGIPLQPSAASELVEDKIAHLGFFRDEAATHKLLEEESKQHLAAGNLELAAHLELWTGNLEPLLREAGKKKQLTDWLVSLAPRVSKEFWEEICKSYAEQLSTEGEIRKASSYFAACGKTDEALDLLIHHNLFREAICIARSAGLSDESVSNYLTLWAVKSAQDGNIELASKCYLAANKPAEAARTLARRADNESLLLAADFARASGLEELADAYSNEAKLKESSGNGENATPEEN